MANATFDIDFTEIKEFQEKLKMIPNESEEIINKVLFLDGVSILTEDVTRFIPTSKRKKRHAADSNWSKAETFNLGFKVISRGGAASNKNSFGYLIFPDEGRGVRNAKAQDFTGAGQKEATPKIMEILNTEINKKIMEVLK